MQSSFAALGVPSEIVDILTAQGITEAFPIQSATIAEAITGRDVCAKAPTGSGKTLAFGIPLITRIERARPRCPRALVLVPTRELAMQVAEVIRPLANAVSLRVAEVFGGTGYGEQAKQIRHGCDIVVACPGRLLDLLERGDLMLKDVGVVVLDEADRMADMGFLPDVRKLMTHVIGPHQFMLFSATLDGSVNTFIKQNLKDPFRFEVKADHTPSKALHLFWKTERNKRVQLAVKIASAPGTTIVFCRTKRGADRLSNDMRDAGVHAVVIHGDRSQAQRTRALEQFTDGKASVLVATDVAARGIHVDNIDRVLHFDQAMDFTDYVHRSGRTARAGGEGTVISIVSPDQVRSIKKMQIQLKMNEPIIDADVENLPEALIARAPKPRVSRVRDDDGRPSRGRGDSSRGGSSGRSGGSRDGGRSGGSSRGSSSRGGYSRDNRGNGAAGTGQQRSGRTPYARAPRDGDAPRGERSERSDRNDRGDRDRGERSGRSESRGGYKGNNQSSSYSRRPNRDGDAPRGERSDRNSGGSYKGRSDSRDNGRTSSYAGRPARDGGAPRGERSDRNSGGERKSSYARTETRGGRSGAPRANNAHRAEGGERSRFRGNAGEGAKAGAGAAGGRFKKRFSGRRNDAK